MEADAQRAGACLATATKKKRKKEISTLGIFFGSDEKKNVGRNLMSKRKEKTPTYLEPSETAYSDTKTITKEKDS